MIVQPGQPQPWLHPLTAEEWFGMPEPTARWLVKYLVPAEGLTMLSGPRKKGYKTWTAFLIAALVLTGGKFWNYPTWEATEPGNVLILEQESTMQDNRRRFQNILRGLKQKPDASSLKGKLHFALRSMLKLDDPRMVADVIKFLKDNEIKLLVLDSLTFMHHAETNSEREMGVVAGALADIRGYTGASVLWLSHTNKEGEAIDRDPDLDVRGSTILADVYDAHIAVRRKKKGRLTFFCKFRETEERELEVYWNLPPSPADGSPAIGEAYPDVREVTGEQRANDAVSRLIEAGWKTGAVYPMAAFRGVLGLSSGAASELRARLIKEGKILPGPDGTGVVLPKGV